MDDLHLVHVSYALHDLRNVAAGLLLNEAPGGLLFQELVELALGSVLEDEDDLRWGWNGLLWWILETRRRVLGCLGG